MSTVAFSGLQRQYRSLRLQIDGTIRKVMSESCYVHGGQVEKFEKTFAQYIGARNCIGVNSGTDALILGVRALEFTNGDEIIFPANTFVASALSASENGVKPVFCDIDPEDYGISLVDLKKKVTSRTRGIMLAHLYGQSDKIDEVRQIIKKSNRKIHLIEDACQAHGAFYKNRRVGSFGTFAAFSFYPTKNLGAYGDGGAIVTDNARLAKKYRMLSEYGQKTKYVHETSGVNSRLDTIQAAILLVKLRHLDCWNRERQAKADRYTSLLAKKVPFIKTPPRLADRKSIYHLYIIRCQYRDRLMAYLKKKGITTLIHYPVPLHLQKVFGYLGYKRGDLPAAEQAADNIVSLPLYPELSDREISYVVNNILSFYNGKQ